MANDRIRLCCTGCKKSIRLYKYYPSGGYLNDREVLDEFIKHHLFESNCTNLNRNINLEGKPRFYLKTESYDDIQNIPKTV